MSRDKLLLKTRYRLTLNKYKLNKIDRLVVLLPLFLINPWTKYRSLRSLTLSLNNNKIIYLSLLLCFLKSLCQFQFCIITGPYHDQTNPNKDCLHYLTQKHAQKTPLYTIIHNIVSLQTVINDLTTGCYIKYNNIFYLLWLIGSTQNGQKRKQCLCLL